MLFVAAGWRAQRPRMTKCGCPTECRRVVVLSGRRGTTYVTAGLSPPGPPWRRLFEQNDRCTRH